MKQFPIVFTIFIGIASGCSIGKPRYQVLLDPAFAEVSQHLTMTISGDLSSDDGYEIAFGSYHVSGLRLEKIRRKDVSSTNQDYSWVVGEQTPNFTGDPWAGVFQLLLPVPTAALEQEQIVKKSISRKISYSFTEGEQLRWTAHCAFTVNYEKEEKHKLLVVNKHKSDPDPEYSYPELFRYACIYARVDSEPWKLVITGKHLLAPSIRLHHGKNTYSADMSISANVTTNSIFGKDTFEVISGYYWRLKSENVGAVANLLSDTPSIWLPEDGSVEINSGIAMASTGLLLFRLLQDEMKPAWYE